jgi:uroporphyrinogen decarboxylase
MNSLERVRNAIRGEAVDDIPVSFELVGETDLKELYFGVPLDWKPNVYKPFVFDVEDLNIEVGARREDEWGVVWGYGDTCAATGIPLTAPVEDIDDIAGYKFPDPYGRGRFDRISPVVKAYRDKYCYVTWFGLLFERLHFLLGFDNALIELATNTKKIEYALDRIVEFDIGLINNLADTFKGDVKAFAATDDWGGQQNLFIDPQVWRKVFKPRYAKISNQIHKRGLDFWLHSDGKIEEIIPDLIEIGVDVFNLNTPRLLGIREFGQRFGGQACFCIYMDMQKTAVSGTPEELVKDAHDLVDYWSNERGSRVLAMDYRGNEIYQGVYSQEEILERKRIALGAFKEAFRNKTRRMG